MSSKQIAALKYQIAMHTRLCYNAFGYAFPAYDIATDLTRWAFYDSQFEVANDQPVIQVGEHSVLRISWLREHGKRLN